jgi:hypothetical protein
MYKDSRIIADIVIQANMPIRDFSIYRIGTVGYQFLSGTRRSG